MFAPAQLGPGGSADESPTLFDLGLVVVLAAAAPLIAQALRRRSILVLLALGLGPGAIGPRWIRTPCSERN